jgi:hypothetical protein
MLYTDISFLSSCYSHSSKIYQEQKINSKFVTYKKIEHSFFWGLQERDEQKCKNGQAIETKSKNGFLNYFIRIYTLGIYWPITFEVSCLN